MNIFCCRESEVYCERAVDYQGDWMAVTHLFSTNLKAVLTAIVIVCLLSLR